MTLDGRQIGILILVVCAAVYIWPAYRQARRILDGRRPKRGTYKYVRSVTLINILNELRGAPAQTVPYEWQWRLLGWYMIAWSAVCAIWIPVGIVLLVRSCS